MAKGGRRKSARLHPGECKISGCTEPSKGARYFRLCEAHYACAKSDRGQCQHRGCKTPRCMPYADGYCEQHHPGKQALTTHEKMIMDGAVAGKPLAQIAKEVGMRPGNVAKVLGKPTVRAAVEVESVRTGFTTGHVMQTLMDATKAEKVLVTRDRESGEPVPVPAGPDWDIRLRACEMGTKVLGLNAPVKTEQDVTTTNQTLVILPPVSQIGLDHPVKVLERKVVGE